ncbi:MAG: beta-lactamase family protein [Bernardetiaceae bacterium]|nr:beta-lactamase family protein [Bernardetiaceae bacterium]
MSLFSFMLLIPDISAQDLNTKRLDSLFAHIETNNKAMGSFAMSQDGKQIYEAHFGYSHVENQTKNSAKTRYHIGSISKTFTAALIFILIEDGKISLDTKLAQYFPEVPNAEKIQIRHLLLHRSGIFNFTNDPAYLTWLEEERTQAQIIELIAKYDPAFEPDSTISYSNSGYVLLGNIIEKVSGMSYAEFMKQEICDKIGLKHTTFATVINPENNDAYSYTNVGKWQKATQTYMLTPHAAGAIVSTPAELLTFFNALFEGKIIKKASLDTMTTILEGMGMGIFTFPFYEHTALGHTGGIDGFSSVAAYFPKEKMSIAYCSNGQSMEMNDIIIGVLSIYFNKPYEFPNFKQREVSQAQLEAYVGTYGADNFPLDISITTKNGVLIAQATGQMAFKLDADGEEHHFSFKDAGISLEFVPNENKMILKQGGGVFTLIKQE